MAFPKKYYWKDPVTGKVRSSMGIELTEQEKGELARKNNQLLREQRNELARSDTKSGK